MRLKQDQRIARMEKQLRGVLSEFCAIAGQPLEGALRLRLSALAASSRDKLAGISDSLRPVV